MSRETGDLLYDPQHFWIDVDGDEAYIGLSEYAQDKLGEILFIELPDLDEFNEGDYFMSVESAKREQELTAPFNLEVLEVKEELEESPELVNDDAIENWICKVKILDPDALDELLDYATYRNYTQTGAIE